MRVLVQYKWLILNQVVSLLVIRNLILHAYKTRHIPLDLYTLDNGFFNDIIIFGIIFYFD